MNDETLDESELAGLAELVRVIAEIDGFVTLEESDAMDAIADWVGAERFSAAFAEARKRTVSAADLERIAGTIQRRSTREIIFPMLRQLAAADGGGGDESSALYRLGDLWGLAQSP